MSFHTPNSSPPNTPPSDPSLLFVQPVMQPEPSVQVAPPPESLPQPLPQPAAINKKTWTTAEECEYLRSMVTAHIYHRARHTLHKFWPVVFNEYFSKFNFPIRLFGKPQSNLTPPEAKVVGKHTSERKQQIKDWFHNNSKESRRRSRAEADSVLRKFAQPKKKVRTRAPKHIEVFSALFYRDVEDGPITDRITEIMEQPEEYSLIGSLRDQKLHAYKIAIKEAWDQASTEVKSQVAEVVEKETKRVWAEKEKGVKKQDDGDEVADRVGCIQNLHTLVSELLLSLHKSTQLNFTLLAAGVGCTDPNIRVHSFHVGKTLDGRNFEDHHPEFTERILKPFQAFARECIDSERREELWQEHAQYLRQKEEALTTGRKTQSAPADTSFEIDAEDPLRDRYDSISASRSGDTLDLDLISRLSISERPSASFNEDSIDPSLLSQPIPPSSPSPPLPSPPLPSATPTPVPSPAPTQPPSPSPSPTSSRASTPDVDIGLSTRVFSPHMPVYAKNSVTWWVSLKLGSLFDRSVAAYLDLEDSLDWTGTGKSLPRFSDQKVGYRPDRLEYWMKRGRVVSKPPPIADVNTYRSEVMAWWLAMQPAWRKPQDGSSLPLKRYQTVDEDGWAPLVCLGKDGLYTFLMSLAWWGRSCDEKDGCLWESVTRDVARAFEAMLECGIVERERDREAERKEQPRFKKDTRSKSTKAGELVENAQPLPTAGQLDRPKPRRVTRSKGPV